MSDLTPACVDAYAKVQGGDNTKLKTFTNTTLGETWAPSRKKPTPIS
jgi:phage terminase large subunit GpA-like protein